MKKILYSLLTSSFVCISINANEVSHEIFSKNFKVSLAWLEDKPKSYSKDFYIIQFLKQRNISVEEANKAFSMAKRPKDRVLKAYRKIVSAIPSKDIKCYRAKSIDLLNEDDRCLALGLSIYEATKLKKKDINKAISKLDKYPTLKNDFKIIASEDSFNMLMKDKNHRFFRLFFKAGKHFRRTILNHKIPIDFLNKISKEKEFNRFVKYVVLDNKLNYLQSSLLNTIDNKKIEHKTLFYLAINAIKLENKEKAIEFLDSAYKKAYFQFDRDKTIFWKYLVNNNKKDLDILVNSFDNNIYSLYAKELLNIKPTNIIHKIDIPNTKTDYNIYDQFKWIDVLKDTKKNFDEKKLKKYKELFTEGKTLPHLAYVLERYYKYKKEYYITPFQNIIKNFTLKNQILIYALAKQESRFIPSSISFSTAQGVMQIMPFLSKDIARRYEEPYNIYEQFKPEVNITYANRHLRVLRKQFKDNPLFIAYAYNGGAGYTKSQLKKGLFKHGKYEPFLSMETISYEETRKYGKKVLANYYIYNNYLNKEKPVKLSTLLGNLIQPD